MIAVRAQHGDAGHVLRGHRDHEQRYADTDDRREREVRHGENGVGERDVELAEVEQTERPCGHDADHERHQDGVAGREAFHDQIGEEHRQDEGGLELGGLEYLDADLEQDAGQQCGGNAGGDFPHERIKPAGEADDGQQNRADDESADRVGIRHVRKRCHEQGGAGRRPGTTIGARNLSERPIVQSAMPMESAQIQEEICASERWAARPAWNMRTSELV